MKLLYAVALVALSVGSAVAQTQYADSSGAYVAVGALGAANSSGGVSGTGVDATVGYRFTSGADAGLRLGRVSAFGGTTNRIGPTAGISRSLGSGVIGRLEASTLFSETHYPLSSEGIDYSIRSWEIGGDVTATVSRPVRVVGSVRLRPTLGVYAAAARRGMDINGPGQFAGDTSPRSSGLHVEVPLSFRLFGQEAAISQALRFPMTGGFAVTNGVYAGGGVRLNF